MRVLLALTFAVMIALAPVAPTRAALSPETSAPPSSRNELVVIEVTDCAYCRVFRRDLLPAYAASNQARDVPIRFLKVDEVSRSGSALRAPINIVPTVLVLEQGREIGRIPGLTGQDTFFRAIDLILGRPSRLP